MTRRLWSPAEDDELCRQHIEDGRSLRQIRIKGRTTSAILNRAWILGLAEERADARASA